MKAHKTPRQSSLAGQVSRAWLSRCHSSCKPRAIVPRPILLKLRPRWPGKRHFEQVRLSNSVARWRFMGKSASRDFRVWTKGRRVGEPGESFCFRTAVVRPTASVRNEGPQGVAGASIALTPSSPTNIITAWPVYGRSSRCRLPISNRPISSGNVSTGSGSG